MQTVHNYHPDTAAYVSSGLADESPLEPGVFLVPAHATTIEPPATGTHEAAIFVNGGWRIVPDFRGTSYWLDGVRHEIEQLGETVPAGASLEKPQASPEQTRASAWEKIKAERDRRLLTGGFPLLVDGAEKWFHSDHTSRSQQLALDALASRMKAAGAADGALVTPVPWKTMDGSKLPMTVGLALKLLPAIATQEGQNHQAAETHRASMEASDDPAAYDFTGGWPPAFET